MIQALFLRWQCFQANNGLLVELQNLSLWRNIEDVTPYLDLMEVEISLQLESSMVVSMVIGYW